MVPTIVEEKLAEPPPNPCNSGERWGDSGGSLAGYFASQSTSNRLQKILLVHRFHFMPPLSPMLKPSCVWSCRSRGRAFGEGSRQIRAHAQHDMTPNLPTTLGAAPAPCAQHLPPVARYTAHPLTPRAHRAPARGEKMPLLALPAVRVAVGTSGRQHRSAHHDGHEG